MKNLTFFTTLLTPFFIWAQLTVSNAFTPQQLVQNVLAGSEVTVSNVSYTGHPSAIGFFNGANSNIGLNSGVLMTTGLITNAQGPNQTDATTEENGRPGYALLNPIARGATEDACVLEFDFEAKHPIVEFTFVFGSEEYLEYVNSEYNDVFGFFVSGPGITGQQNIALVPGTNVPITINTINNNANGNYYVNNTNGGSVEYDGFTKPLTARIRVTPCQKYHIILAIADVADQRFDSGVFLEANSFVSPTITVNRQVNTGPNDSTMYEGCSDAQFILTRTGSIYSSYPINLQFTGTAANGVDYQSIPLTTSFPAGTNVLTLPIQSIFDGVTEPIESVTLVYTEVSCPDNIIKQSTIYIQDPPLLTVTASRDTTVLCPNLLIPATAQATGGVGQPYSYVWTPLGTVGATVNLPTNRTQTYTVTATDACNAQRATAEVTINLNYTFITTTSSDDATICKNDSVKIWGRATGGRGGLQTYWEHNSVTKDTITVQPPNTTTYYYVAKDSCGVIEREPVVVTTIQVDANFEYTYEDNHIIQYENTSSPNASSFYWNFGNDSSSLLEHPKQTYSDTGLFNTCLVVKTDQGCLDTACQWVRVYPPYQFWIPNTFTPNDDQDNDYFLGLGEGFVETEMNIYNRWGELVFSTDRIGKGWNGLYNTQESPLGVYTYTILNKTPSNKEKYHQGHLNLIR